MLSGKIQNLKQSMISMGVSYSVAQVMCNEAELEIVQEMKNIVEVAVYDVVNIGSGMDADEFLAQISLNHENGYVQIGTDSGTLDFSRPKTPMLPWLLKNAKVAKDGSRYKVIPVGSSKDDKPKKQAKDISSGISSMMQARPSKLENMAQQISQQFNVSASRPTNRTEVKTMNTSNEFRVASDKQDPDTNWVLPEKKLDLSGAVMEINNRIRDDINRIADGIVNQYLMEAQWRL
jgi:hypothetical protein